MSISKYSLIDVPSGDGVHTKIAGAKGEKYVYKYMHYFRNAEDKSRNRTILIGKFDAETGKMEPNSYNYDLFKIALGMLTLQHGTMGTRTWHSNVAMTWG